MYNEINDFLHHKNEIDTFFDITKLKSNSKDMTILDIGAGQGMHTGFLSEYFKYVYASDIIDYSSLYNGEFLKLLNQKHIRNNFYFNLKKISFVTTSAMNLIYRDNYFNVVLSINAFEHIPDIKTALTEIVRVTKPGGNIYITFDPIWTSSTGSHFFHIVPEPWAHLFSDFEDKMIKNGASEYDINEYKYGMNRKRICEYEKVFSYFIKKRKLKLIYNNKWGATEGGDDVLDSHLLHENYNTALKKGYTKEELITRGFMFYFKKLN